MGKKMLKEVSSIFVVAVLATGFVAQGKVASKEVLGRNLPFLQAQVNSEEKPLSVALPTLAEVFLKGGESMSGRVMEIDSQGQKLWMQRDREKASIPLGKVEKVVFKDDNVFYRSDGIQVMRGSGGTEVSPAGGQVSLPNIPLNAFRLRDANKGLAEVSLGTGGLSRGIRDTAKTRQFVVDEMQFNLPKKTMMILATPY